MVFFVQKMAFRKNIKKSSKTPKNTGCVNEVTVDTPLYYLTCQRARR